jgi:thiamine pyrophosphate-dependent acetolactate synthase large subunit-like protein
MPIMTGSRFFAEAMRGYGVTHVFFVPAILPDAMAAMGDMGVTRILTHGETAAGYMADGYARASGRPGVCLAQAVGSANLAAGVRDAYLASSPVIAISGGPHPDSRYRHLYQVVEDFSMFGPITKFNARVDHPRRLPDLLRQAFRMATSGAPGPVHLEISSCYSKKDSAAARPIAPRLTRARSQKQPDFSWRRKSRSLWPEEEWRLPGRGRKWLSLPKNSPCPWPPRLVGKGLLPTTTPCPSE